MFLLEEHYGFDYNEAITSYQLAVSEEIDKLKAHAFEKAGEELFDQTWESSLNTATHTWDKNILQISEVGAYTDHWFSISPVHVL